MKHTQCLYERTIKCRGWNIFSGDAKINSAFLLKSYILT